MLWQSGTPLALDRDMCGVTEVALRSGRGASASRVPLGYEVQRRRHGGALITLHSGVEVCCLHTACTIMEVSRNSTVICMSPTPKCRNLGVRFLHTGAFLGF